MASIPDFTVVLGVDDKHLRQLSWTLPTWRRHKPSLMDRPWVVFYDRFELGMDRLSAVLNFVPTRVDLIPWPPDGVEYDGDPGDKWTDPQRTKMLSGFVHVAAAHVRTPWWLKLDCDVVATGQDDWIDPAWFEGDPAIVSHGWSFTKPPTQMDDLDDWAMAHPDLHFPRGPLRLHPQKGSDRLGHKRIISWCSFWRTDFTRWCASAAEMTCGEGHLPVRSQDGYLWYMSQRFGLGVVRTNMKKHGFMQWCTNYNIVTHAREAMR